MTLDQIQDIQRAHGEKTGSSAIGRYQIIRKTLAGLMKKLSLSPNLKFTPELQDRLALALLEDK